jgi:parallel beta-helix repeat protein
LNGIYVWGDTSNSISTNNIISGNQIENNKNGVLIEATSNTKISGNNIKSNSGWGLILNYLGNNSFSNNTILHNNFENKQQILYDDDDEPARDNWDNGEAGNYWSNYNGTDSNGDGIGDTAYIINEENQDNYPLMQQMIIPEFHSWTILIVGLSIVLILSIIYRQRIKEGRKK